MFQNNVTVFAKLMYPEIATILSNTTVARSALDKKVSSDGGAFCFFSFKGHFILQKVISHFSFWLYRQ